MDGNYCFRKCNSNYVNMLNDCSRLKKIRKIMSWLFPRQKIVNNKGIFFCNICTLHSLIITVSLMWTWLWTCTHNIRIHTASITMYMILKLSFSIVFSFQIKPLTRPNKGTTFLWIIWNICASCFAENFTFHRSCFSQLSRQIMGAVGKHLCRDKKIRNKIRRKDYVAPFPLKESREKERIYWSSRGIYLGLVSI